MNVLLTSVGRRVKVVQYFTRAMAGEGRVIAVDCDKTAPALYAADYQEQVPRIGDPVYIPALLEICHRYEVQAVITLIDPELTLLAAHREIFQQQNIQVVVPPSSVVDTCLDKKATQDFLIHHHLPYIPTYTDWNEIIDALACGKLAFPLMVKPRKGSASLGITKVETLEELQLAFFKGTEIVVQPFIHGEEYGVDAYVDLVTGIPVSIFTRKKLRMRAGETDRSLAVKDQQLTGLIMDLLSVLQPVGPVDIDCFRVGEHYVVSEINPRFGGGYPHAYESGENFISFLLKNIGGIANNPRIGQYREGSMMIKYDDVMMVGFDPR